MKLKDISKLTPDEKDYFFERLAYLKVNSILSEQKLIEEALRDTQEWIEKND